MAYGRLQASPAKEPDMSRPKTYALADWYVAEQDPARIVYRPGAQVFLNRLAWTVLAALVIAAAHSVPSAGRGAPEPRAAQKVAVVEALRQSAEDLQASLRQNMSDEQWTKFQAELDQRDARRTKELAADEARLHTFRAIGQTVYWAVVGFFGSVGVLAPLSCLWNRIVIEREPAGDLSVTTRWLWPSRRAWPILDVGAISIAVWEVTMAPIGRPWRRRTQWRWVVQPTVGGSAEPEAPDRAVAFMMCRQPTRPIEGSPPPEPVQVFAEWLSGATGLPTINLPLPQYRTDGTGGSRRARRVTYTTEPVVQTSERTYTSIDQLPPEIRAKAERALAAARQRGKSLDQPIEIVSEEITIRDSTGRVRTYRSVDDMPAEDREIYEQLRRRRRK